MRRLSASVLMLGLMAGSAHAAVTAEDIWRDWQAYLSGFGYEVTGAPQRSAGRIVIPDLGLAQDIPDDGGRVALRMGRIDLVERGDGTVSVVYTETMPMALAITPEEGETITAILTLAHSGLAIIASGTPEALRYVYSADSVSLKLGEVTIDGAPQETLAGALDLTGLTGTSMMQPDGAARQMMQDFTSGPISYALRAEKPEEGNGFDYQGTAESARYDARMRLPDGIDMARMGDALAAGLEIEGKMRFGAGEGRYAVTEAGETSHVTSQSARSTLDIALSAEGVSYGGEVEELQTEMAVPMLPMPLSYGAARMAGKFTMPLTPGEALRDFGLLFDLSGVTLSDSVWALFDPGASLPRDPMELLLDLTGKGRLTVDLFDPAKMAALDASGEAPGEIERLDLNRLLISAAGAKLTGAVGVDIDPAKGAEMPPAEGAVDLRLEGGNALLERLVAMGFVSRDQALMVGMMAGLFAQTEGDTDTLTSRVEVKKDGALTVNGQKLR